MITPSQEQVERTTKSWYTKNRPRGDHFTKSLLPSLSLQIVTTALPLQLKIAVFFPVILNGSSVRFLSVFYPKFVNDHTSKLIKLPPRWHVGFWKKGICFEIYYKFWIEKGNRYGWHKWGNWANLKLIYGRWFQLFYRYICIVDEI